jgi:hypothetical protein
MTAFISSKESHPQQHQNSNGHIRRWDLALVIDSEDLNTISNVRFSAYIRRIRSKHTTLAIYEHARI